MLQGNLADFPLLGILQMLGSTARTGKVLVEHPRGGEIYIASGQVCHAYALSHSGFAALSVLSSIDQAPFDFEQGAQSGEITLDVPTSRLLTDLMGETDAWRPLNARFPDWNARISFNPDWSAHTEGSVSALEWSVLSLVSGDPIHAMVRASGLAPRATLEVLRRFHDEGALIVDTPPLELPRLSLAALPLYSKETEVAFIDAGLHAEWSARLGPLHAEISTPKGQRARFVIRPRENLEGRIALSEAALRALRVGRGTLLSLEFMVKETS
ncbi:hypothetical protein HNR42_000883 [Deinobacterium chartae]|uniref:PatA-like N-terminal domain-containing protein n=1 Tax=Deinobacterium chartae TaxID=521158 RepID=A0A841HX17_9DEIO|nr:DUF4388 domain-containing protein [Deinobacterium chartae]MBB6097466.1 hypothetical protein [Deinobacterium chartae]